MSGPNSVITIHGNIERSLMAEQTTLALAAEAVAEALAAKELADMRSKVDKDNIILTKRTKSTLFLPGQDIQKFQVHPEDPTKTASMGWSAGCFY